MSGRGGEPPPADEDDDFFKQPDRIEDLYPDSIVVEPPYKPVTCPTPSADP